MRNGTRGSVSTLSTLFACCREVSVLPQPFGPRTKTPPLRCNAFSSRESASRGMYMTCDYSADSTDCNSFTRQIVRFLLDRLKRDRSAKCNSHCLRARAQSCRPWPEFPAKRLQRIAGRGRFATTVPLDSPRAPGHPSRAGVTRGCGRERAAPTRPVAIVRRGGRCGRR